MSQNLVVVKDNKLIQASYKLTLIEQRIILSCIAKIDSSKELSEGQGFTITVSEIQDLMTDNRNIKSMYADVKDAVERLWNREIKLDDKGSAIRWLVEKDMYHSNEGRVTLHFSSKIIPYLSQLKDNFTKYRLEWVSKFKSTHSIRIYELLVQWTSKGEREVELDWLKNVLQVNEKYQRTNNFIQRVIKPSIDEINEYSNLSVSYGVRKSGRTITHIQFKFDVKEQSIKQNKKNLTLQEFVRNNQTSTKGKSEIEVRQMMNLHLTTNKK